MKKVLLLKAGQADPSICLQAGDYDLWFRQSVGTGLARLHRVDAFLNAPLPRARDFDAVWMTGSALSVTQLEDWMRRAGDYLLEAAQQHVPVLGVCFGHQLLARALGVPVIRNPRGREIGSVDIALTDFGVRDPLFARVPSRFAAQATHQDIIAHLPQGATCLAGNANTPVQSFAYGASIRAVQFHPELSPGGMRAVIRSRQSRLEEEALSERALPGTRVRELHAGVRPSPYGKVILENFLRHFV